MKRKHDEGFTLVEMLVSIVILAAIVIPTCTSLTLSFRMNAKADDMMKAQLAVSSTVETLMATGITEEFLKAVIESNSENKAMEDLVVGDQIKGACSEFPGLTFSLTFMGDYYDLIVSDEEKLVDVNTSIRVAKGGS